MRPVTSRALAQGLENLRVGQARRRLGLPGRVAAECLLERVERQGARGIGIAAAVPARIRSKDALASPALSASMACCQASLSRACQRSACQTWVLKAMLDRLLDVDLVGGVSAGRSPSRRAGARRGRATRCRCGGAPRTGRGAAGPGSSSPPASSCSSASSRTAGSRSGPGRTSGGCPCHSVADVLPGIGRPGSTPAGRIGTPAVAEVVDIALHRGDHDVLGHQLEMRERLFHLREVASRHHLEALVASVRLPRQ